MDQDAKKVKIPQGGFLALDWGKRKVGYATCDELGLVVTPRSMFERKKNQTAWKLTTSDIEEIQKLLEEFESGGIILGLPKSKSGEETEGSIGARSLAKELKENFKIPVILVSETLTSWEARSFEKSESEDAKAASLLIEDFLRSSNMKNKSGFVKSLTNAMLVLLVLASFAAYKFYYDFTKKPVSKETGEFIVDVPPQATFFSVRNSLAEQGIVIDRFAYRLWTMLNGAERKLRVGEYRIQKNWPVQKVLDEILLGQVLLHKVIIKEGQNIYDIESTFSGTAFAQKSANIDSILRDPKLIERMEIPKLPPTVNRTLEGYLFPETYSYQKYDSPQKLVLAMLDQFEKRALPLLKNHAWGDTPEGRYRLLTLASVVEKESGVASEQPTIASVFWNRLKKRMRLQSDPTTIYALLPDFDGDLKRSHLTSPSPYNTYTLPELPAGPICNPGETAIRAVLEPEQSDYYYFVARGDGTHAFSKDYKTHAARVREFQLRGH